MTQKTVAVVKYEKPLSSVRKAVSMANGLKRLSPGMKVFIKPNIVYWTRAASFHLWGVITTSRVIEDAVTLLKERGVEDITVGEGIVTFNPQDRQTPSHAFETLGYNVLASRYGVKCLNLHERPFETVNMGRGISLNFNADILKSDFVIDVPVLKTHAQTVVSLGIKNLKGTLDFKSRKRCHSADPDRDLHSMIARLPRVIQPDLTILDGIYTNERGPGFDGKLRRSNILVASTDMLSADMVGARILGYDVSEVPHLAWAARDWERPVDFSDISIVGEEVRSVASPHAYAFPYAEEAEESLPLPMKRMGIQGLSYRKYDLTMCTYCSYLNGRILNAIAQAWRGEPWDDVEVLTGKAMKPTPGKKKTILIGKCIYQANKDNSDINEMIPVKGCPPSTEDIVKAFRRAGIHLDPKMLEDVDTVAQLYAAKYEGRPGFDEAFFKIRSDPAGTEQEED
jgi:uncharacterized protein (DUF362 family)